MRAIMKGVNLSSSSVFFSGGLAQLARALAWHARGHRFEPDILHPAEILPRSIFDMLDKQDCRLDKVFSTIQLKV